MSLGSRIKERREQLDLSRNELATRIGVTPSAIANYENEISSPKIELMYKLFNALECDANYLHQDDMDALIYENTTTPEEFEKIIKKYRKLDTHGKEMVDFTLLKEWERSTDLAKEKSNVTPMTVKEDMPDYLKPQAAHNDHINEEGELEKMQDDLAMLDAYKKNH